MRIGWASDIHLNFVTDRQFAIFVEQLRNYQVQALLITGDIAEAPSLMHYLDKLLAQFDMPFYFVLGNHDFYRGEVAAVRELVCGTAYPQLVYLTAQRKPVHLSDEWALVGADGWGDARVGDPLSRRVEIADWSYIEDIRRVGGQYHIPDRIKAIQKLSDGDVASLKRTLFKALEKYQNVIVATHVPPFNEAAWYEGKPSNRYWAPWFVWKAGGDLLLKAADRFPTRKIYVVTGHTHGRGTYRAMPNLEVRTAAATYGLPAIEDVIEIPD